jgi:hypothetical protein
LIASDLPRPEEGVIDGKDAISISVTDLGYDSPSRTVFPPDGFSAHIFPGRDWRREEIFPCGSWFLPESGSYYFYIEGNGKLSPFLGTFTFNGRSKRGIGKSAVFPVVEAGRIVVSVDESLPRNATVRLHHVNSHIIDGWIQRGMQRWAEVDEAGRGILMPAGPVLTLLFDEKAERYIAIGRPTELPAGGSAHITLRPPAPGTSDLLVALERPSKVGRIEDDDVELVWNTNEGARPPDLRLATTGFVNAVWYGLTGEGSVGIRSNTIAPETLRVRLDPGRVHRVAHDLRAHRQ